MLAVLLVGCEGAGGSGNGGDAASGAGDVERVSWRPDARTRQYPSFGSSCRYSAGELLRAPANAAADDRFAIAPAESGDGARVEVVVRGDARAMLEASVVMEPTPRGAAWWKAEGQASWDLDGATAQGEVLDGTLCFAEPDPDAETAAAELSLVLEGGDGGRYAVGARFEIPASVATAADEGDTPSYEDEGLRIGLR